MTLLIAGARGGVGRQLIGKLTAQDQAVRALVRDLEQARELFGEQECLTLIEGDTRVPMTLPDALSGVSAVICTTRAKAPVGENSPEKIDYEGVSNLVTAAQSAGVGRFVLVTSIGVTHPEYPLNNFGRMLNWKRKGEDALRASGMVYTIIRPGTLTDVSGGKSALKVAQGDSISVGSVSRSDLAALCLAALDDIATYHTTFEVVEQVGDPPQNLHDFFARLKTDRELSTP